MEEDYRIDFYEVLKKLIWLMCEGDFERQIIILKMILKELRTTSDSQCIGYFEAIGAIISMDTLFINEKIHMIFGVPRLTEEKI